MSEEPDPPAAGQPMPRAPVALPPRPDLPPVLGYAGFGVRTSALLIDLTLFLLWRRILRGVVTPFFHDPRVLGPFRLSAVIFAALFWAYFVLTTRLVGGTVGKRAMRLRVVTTGFGRPDWTTVLFREVIGRIIVTGTVFIGYLWVAVDRRRQGWHDKIADTYVVRRVAAIVRPDPWEAPEAADEVPVPA